MLLNLLGHIRRAVACAASPFHAALVEVPRWGLAWWRFGYQRLATHFRLQRRIKGCCGCGRLTLPGEAFFSCALCEDYEACADCVAASTAAASTAAASAAAAIAAAAARPPITTGPTHAAGAGDASGDANEADGPRQEEAEQQGAASPGAPGQTLHRHDRLVRDVLVATARQWNVRC